MGDAASNEHASQQDADDTTSSQVPDLAAHLAAVSLGGDEAAPVRSKDGAGKAPMLKQPAQAALAGMDPVLDALRESIVWPALYGNEAAALGVAWPAGVLLHGPPGCGKTAAVRAVAAEAGAELLHVSAATIFGAYTGESEARLREAWAAARAAAADSGKMVVMFLDEADALAPARSAVRPHEARVVAQLLTLLDGAGRAPAGSGRVVVVAATNRPNALDPALRRPGRLDHEIEVSVPGLEAREAILRLHAAALPVAPGVDLADVARACHGYSGADLAALCREAAMHALCEAAGPLLEPASPAHPNSPPALPDAPAASVAALARRPEGERPEEDGGGGPGAQGGGVPEVSAEDFAAARMRVPPSVTRGYELELVPVAWDDIGGLEDVKLRLRQAVEWPLKHAAAFARLGLAPSRGILLYGPPGCCKTTLARAAAGATGGRLQALGGAQLFSAFLGEGEAVLRSAFARARLAAPAMLFIDEIDALAGRRDDGQGGASSGGANEAGVRLLSALLTEMDGLELATGVLVLAATNRPQALDPALLRPGRLDVRLFVPPPDAAGRAATLAVHTRGMPLAPDVSLQALAAATALWTGAELEGLCREAALGALREDLQGATAVYDRHFQAALTAMRPALTSETLAAYAAFGQHP